MAILPRPIGRRSVRSMPGCRYRWARCCPASTEQGNAHRRSGIRLATMAASSFGVRHMDISLARTFLEIVRCGSFVAAAERLHVTQAAITSRIQRLDSQLNSTLLIRYRYGDKMNADGVALHTHASHMIHTLY